VLSPPVTGTVIAGFAASHASTETLTKVAGLSDREPGILTRVGQALSNIAIAERLYLSAPAAKEHASAIFRRLGTENRVHAAVIAPPSGDDLGTPGPVGAPVPWRRDGVPAGA